MRVSAEKENGMGKGHRSGNRSGGFGSGVIKMTVEQTAEPDFAGAYVGLYVPIEEAPQGYVSRHLEVGSMTQEQGLAVKMLLGGLMREQAKLADGRSVSTPAGAIRWLLEQLSGSAGMGACGRESASVENAEKIPV